jgi:hypothetical protein
MTLQTSSIDILNDDCILEIIKHLPIKERLAFGASSMRHRLLGSLPSNWHYVTFSGEIARITAFIKSLIQKGSASAITHMEFVDVRFPRPLLVSSPPSDESVVVISDFFMATETLFSHTKRLNSLLIDEQTVASGIYELGSTRFFGPILKHCKHIKSLTLLSSEEADYVGDNNILLLSQLPAVESFVDGQAFGLSMRSLCFVAEGFTNLKTLKTNTECKSVCEFVRWLARKSLQGLQSLGVTHFQDNLVDVIDTFVDGLRLLTDLRTFSLDLQFTRFGDAFGTMEWGKILRACPSIRRVDYTVGIESFIGQDDELDGLEEEPPLSEISASLSSTSSKWSTKKHQGYFADLERVRELFALRNVELNLNWSV